MKIIYKNEEFAIPDEEFLKLRQAALLTYNSCAIEGNSLTFSEVLEVIIKQHLGLYERQEKRF